MKLTDQPIIDALKAGKAIRRDTWSKEQYIYVKSWGSSFYGISGDVVPIGIVQLEATDWGIVEND